MSDKNNDDNGDDEQEPTDGPRRTPPQEPLLALAERNVRRARQQNRLYPVDKHAYVPRVARLPCQNDKLIIAVKTKVRLVIINLKNN